MSPDREGASSPENGQTLTEVSVIIPTRNRLEMLREAVGSVWRQTFPHWQLVVVDDASTDSTGEWLASLPERRIDIVRLEKHCERSAARNRGLALARGDHVLFLDDDDRLRPEALGRLLQAMQRRPGMLAGVGASIAMVDGRRVRQRSRGRPLHPWLPITRSVCADVSLGWYSLPGQTLFRRGALEEVGGWNESVALGEDYELWARLAPLGLVAFVPSVVLERGVPARPPHDQPTVGTRAALMYPEEVGQLSGRFRRARELYLDAIRSLDDDPRGALRGLAAALRTDPHMLLSPLTGPTAAAHLGRALTRWVTARLRPSRGRA
jgi:glycosyltransferase involved in cell wall biosynthesis